MRTAHEVSGARLWRTLGVGAGVFSLVALRPWIGRWIARGTSADRVGAIARIVLAVVLAGVTVEVVLRIKEGPGSAPYRLPKAHDSDRYGWILEPSIETPSRGGERDIVYVVNADGVRTRALGDVVDYAAPTVLFAGESVAFGLGLPYEETFPALVGADLRVHVVNLAVHGYGGDQAYMRTLDYLARFERPLAVVTLFVPEQLPRNVSEDRTRLALDREGGFATVAPLPRWYREMRVRELWKRVFSYHDDEAVSIERAIVDATAKAVRGRGGYPLFVITNYETPCLEVGGKRPFIEGALFGDGGVPKVRVPIDPTWRLPDDSHPDGRAHRVIADAVTAALRGAGISGL